MGPDSNPQGPTSTPPLFNGPFTSPLDTPQVQPTPPILPGYEESPEKKGKSKLLLITMIIAGIELLIILGLLAALANQPKSASNPASPTQSETSGAKEPRAATSLSVQQANDSISNDISGLNVNDDFAESKFDDRAIGL